MIDILDHATQHPMHQFMESRSSYLFHGSSFTPMDLSPNFWSVDQGTARRMAKLLFKDRYQLL